MKKFVFALGLLSFFLSYAEENPDYREACASYSRMVEGMGVVISDKTPQGDKINDVLQAIGKKITDDSIDKAVKTLCGLRKGAQLIQGTFLNRQGILSTCYGNCNDQLLRAVQINEPVRNYLLSTCQNNCKEISLRYDSYSKGLKAGKDSCLIGGKSIPPGKGLDSNQAPAAK